MRDGRKHQIGGQRQNLTKWKSPDRNVKSRRKEE